VSSVSIITASIKCSGGWLIDSALFVTIKHIDYRFELEDAGICATETHTIKQANKHRILTPGWVGLG